MAARDALCGFPDERGRQLLTAPFVLRVSAFVLVIAGFLGIVTTEVSPIPGESLPATAFAIGIGCAIVSIYLGIFTHRIEE